MFKTEVGEGPLRVCMTMENTGNGWYATLLGGEVPHIGGVVLAVPRRSLTGEGIGCDVSIVPVSGHKDTVVMAGTVQVLCKYLNSTVAMTGGIHIDGARPEQIRAITEHCDAAVRNMCDLLKAYAWNEQA